MNSINNYDLIREISMFNTGFVFITQTKNLIKNGHQIKNINYWCSYVIKIVKKRLKLSLY